MMKIALRAFGLAVAVGSGCGVSMPVEGETTAQGSALSLACGEPAPGVYDAYPGQDTEYAIGPASSASAASALSWPGESFEAYTEGSPIECQSTDAVSAWDVITMGQCLIARREAGNGVGSIESDVLRVVATGTSAGKRIGWTDQTVQLRAEIDSFSASSTPASGIRVMARYQTENDFYVASLRKDGVVRIEKRCGGTYTTLAISTYEVPVPGRWYTLTLRVSGSGSGPFSLMLTVNGGDTPLVLPAQDSALPWGTAGFRADGVRGHVDDWYIGRDVRTPSINTQTALQAELDALTQGGVLYVPAASYDIAQTLSVPGDDISIMGAGSAASVLRRPADGTATPLLQVTSHARARISGLGFAGYPAADSTGTETGVELDDASDFRVDHDDFTRLGNSGVKTKGASRGVIDHSNFHDIFKPATSPLGYGVVVYGVVPAAPEDRRPFGTLDATFVEDSQFTRCRHAVSSNKGARYVFRHNAISQNGPEHPIDTHGQEDPVAGNVGTEWADINNNQVTADGANGDFTGYAVRLRGGLGVIWDNQISGFTLAVRLTQETDETTGPINIFDPVPSSTFVVRATNAQGSPSVIVSAPPADYTPQPYPHPLAR